MTSNRPQEWRDLIWAVSSPSLLADGQCSLATIETADFSLIDPDEVVSFVRQQPTHRVGRYFELLLWFYLSRVRRAEIIASGLQIRDGSRTIGELDFVFQDRRSDDLSHHSDSFLMHWESAVKFYLWCPEETVDGSHLIGPTTSDTFERKVRRLRQHQLPLGQSERATRQMWSAGKALDSPPPEAIHQKPQSQAFVKGRIFYPIDCNETHGSFAAGNLPRQLAPNHLHGVWLKESQLDQLEGLSVDGFAFVRKPYWLAPPERFGQSAATVIDQLRMHFQHRRHPQLLACHRCAEPPGEVESQHVFVMPDEWPDLPSG